MAFLLRSSELAAQAPPVDPHTAHPQRPTVATHAGTVATGWLEIESGIEVDRLGNMSNVVGVPLLAKVGLAPRLHLEIQTSFISPPHGDDSGMGDSTLGVKWRLVDDAPVVGDFAVLSSIKVPTGSRASATGTDTTDLNLLLISSHLLGPVQMDLNAGFTRRGADGSFVPRNSAVWTASFGGQAVGRVGWVAELYGYLATSGPAGADAIVAVLAGPTVTIRPWLVLDVGAIVPLAGPQPRALYTGVTYNAGRLWR